MRIVLFSLLVLVLIAGLATIVFTLPRPAGATGFIHDRLETMDQGGDGQRHSSLLWWGCAIAILQVTFFVLCMMLGACRHKRKTAAAGWLALGGVLYAGLFALMVIAYRVYLLDPSFLIFGFPAPTAVMLFLLWPFPFYFVVLYLVRFEDWILSPSDLARFEEIRRSFSADSGERE